MPIEPRTIEEADRMAVRIRRNMEVLSMNAAVTEHQVRRFTLNALSRIILSDRAEL